MRQESATESGRSPLASRQQTTTSDRKTPRAATSAHQAKPAATEVFGSFLRTLEQLDRNASRRASKTGGNS